MDATIEIIQETSLTKEQISPLLEDIIAKIAQQRHPIKGSWKNKNLFVFEGRGFSGHIDILENSISLSVTLEGLLVSFKNIIESSLKETLRETLNP